MKRIQWILISIFTLSLLTACGGYDSTTSYITEGINSVMQENYGQAHEYFTKAVENGENKEEAYRGDGLAYMGEKDYAKAVTTFKKALSYDDLTPGAMANDINHYMAVAYYKLGQYDDAIAVYDAIIDLKPKDEEAMFLRGTMKLYLSDVDGAMADFDSAIALKPKDYSLCLDIYAVMLQNGYPENAQIYMNRVATGDEKSITDYDRGRTKYYQGDYEMATNYLERARTQFPDDGEMIAMLGDCYQRDGKYSFAVAVYEGYVDKVKDPAMYNNIGLCYARQGDYANAQKAFALGQQVENNTCMQTLKLNEVVCYEYLHDYKMAKTKLEEYLLVYPTSTEIAKEWAFLSTR